MDTTTQSTPSSFPKLKFAARGKTGTQLYWGPPDQIRKDENVKGNSPVFLSWSDDGTLILLPEENGFVVLDSETGAVIRRVENHKVVAAHFSPKNSYVTTWERLPSNKPNDANNNNPEGLDSPVTEPNHNLIIWQISSGDIVASFTQKIFLSESWPTIKWSDDEAFCGRLVNNEVQFWEKKDLHAHHITTRLKLPDVTNFAISPTGASSGIKSYKIAAFVKEKKGAPASVQLFKYPNLTERISFKSFFKAQEVDLRWNGDGSALLVFTHTDVDRTGKSYYGETGLHFLQGDGKFETNVALKKDGPIYDIAWSPSNKEFAVVYGFMPAQTTIFDSKCQPLADLGQASRNTCKWSPNGRMLCVGGFGNIQGYMDIWDHKKLKKVGTMQANCASHYEWSPDSRYILTGVLSPRIRVDNGFKVWKYDGSQIYSEDAAELYQVAWRPTSPKLYPDRPPSPHAYAGAKAAEAQQTQKTAKYVPPHLARQGGAAASSTTIQKTTESGPVKYRLPQQQAAKPREEYIPPGYDPEDAKKESRKRNKNKKKESGKAEESVQTTPIMVIQEPSAPVENVDPQKQIRMISKKLRQIDELKEAQSSGKQLDAAQLEKLKAETSLRDQLKSLSVSK